MNTAILQMPCRTMIRSCLALFFAAVVLLLSEQPSSAEGGQRLVMDRGEDRIYGYSLAISSDGRMFVAAESDSDFGRIILINYSEDDGETWSNLSVLSSVDPDRDYVQPSIVVAEGDEDRLFIAYAVVKGLEGRVEVAYRDLDDLQSGWTTTVIDDDSSFPSVLPAITTNADIRPDYSVFVSFADNGEFISGLGFARSMDQGTTWDDSYTEFWSSNLAGPSAIVANDDDSIVVVMSRPGAMYSYRAENFGASPSDWSTSGLFTHPSYIGFFPQLVRWPGTSRLFAAHSTMNEPFSTRIYDSDDGGLSWNEGYRSIPAGMASLAYGYSGFRIAAWRLQFCHLYEPDDIDPSGTWSDTEILTIGSGWADEYGVQLASSAAHPGQWAAVFADGSSSYTLVLFADWLRDAASADELPEVTTTEIDRGVTVHPNPATDRVRFALSDVSASKLQRTIQVTDVSGRSIWHSELAPGQPEVSWNLRDDRGERVARGVYWIRATQSGAPVGEPGRLIVK